MPKLLPKIRMIVNKGLLQIFFALLLVAIIMFVSNYMVYRNSISGIYNQVSENNKLVVKNIIRSFDSSFKDINDVIHAIQMLPSNPWENERTLNGETDMSAAYMIHTNVRELVSPIDYIEEAIVFHPRSELAITASGSIRLEQLLQSRYGSKTYNGVFWKALASTKHPLRIYPAQAYTRQELAGDAGRKLIPVLGSNQVSDLNVLVFLNSEKLLRHVNQQSMMKGTSLIVLDQDRNVILNTEDNWDLVSMLQELQPGPSSETTVKSKDYEYNVFKSEYNGFLYINKTPYQFANMQAVTNVNRQIMLIAIACAVLLSGLLSLYLYRPVQTLVKLIGLRERSGADYRSIRLGIAQIQEENESFKTQMDLFRKEMRRAAFQSTLLDTFPTRETEQRMQRYFPEFFRERYFVLAAFRVGEQAEDDGVLGTGFPDLAAFVENGLGSGLDGVFVFPLTQGRALALVGGGRPTDREAVVDGIRAFVEEAKREAWAGISAAAAVSRMYPAETANVQQAFSEVNDCFEFRNIDSDDAVIDINRIRYTWKVYAPLDEIEKASQSLLIGNADECIRLVNGIVARNEELHIHRRQLVSVVQTIFYAMLKHLEMSDMKTEQIVELEKTFQRELEAAPGAREIQEALLQAIHLIAQKRAGSGQKKKLDPSAIALYIDQHYMDNLHLDHMADRLETTPKYFSNFFKKTFGVNFVEYLNKVRLAHAKELLRQSDLSVAEIGEKTGYLNSSTFTNTFKKYYGISPSEYRRTNAGEAAITGRKK
ncbi:hypothetical protein J31TS4_10960 [Paenibacillus sp. J31TS4]|uniref:helix-turn-helix domain-containing protein n=1 Tax=Paenibacillus sp. J31TS4 TaxID=2807195 RepID=UPI001B1CD7AF|nr:AraC family transcriptional regulator [Paenibacillus sp. J31TS4]GIP37816.1 hypothetical protein J31TS4_10960 [Paenibacillus sp. J31TS4]